MAPDDAPWFDYAPSSAPQPAPQVPAAPAKPAATGVEPTIMGASTPGSRGIEKALGSGLVSGVEAIPAIPDVLMKVIDWGVRQGMKRFGGYTDEEMARNAAAHQKGLIGALNPQNITTPIADVSKKIVDSATGSIADYEPQGTAEKYAKAIGEFAPGLIGGEAGLAGRAISNVIAPAIGTTAAGDYFKGTQFEPYARIAGAVVPSILGHGATKILTPKPAADVVEAAGRLGADVPGAVAAENIAPQRVGQFISNVPLVGDPLVAANTRLTEQLGGAAERTAAQAGATTSYGAGTQVGAGIQDWVKNVSSDDLEQAYKKVGQLVSPTAQSQLLDTQDAINQITARRQAANLTGSSPAVDLVRPGAFNQGGMTFQGIQDLRTNLGQMLKGKSPLPAGWNDAEAKQIYGALTSDLGHAVDNAGGPAAQAAWQQANALAKDISDQRRSLVKIIGLDANAAPAETIYSRLRSMASANGGPDLARLAQARNIVSPQDWQGLAGTIIADMGRDADGNFSAARFLGPNGYNGLSDAGKTLLFKSLPAGDLKQPLDDIATISRQIQKVGKFGNPSGTAQTAAGISGAVELVTHPWATLGAAVPGRILAYALARPASASSIAKYATAYARFVNSPMPATATALALSTRNLSSTLNSQFGTNVDPQDLMPKGAPQGGAPGRAPLMVPVPGDQGQ